MALIKSRRYPEYDTYKGYIHHSSIICKTPRVPGLDSLASRIIIECVETEIINAGGRLLETAVYSENSWWGIIPTYTINIKIKWYIPGEYSLKEQALIADWVLVAIIAAVTLIILVYVSEYYDAVERFGYPPWYSGPFGGLTLLLLAAGGLYLVITFSPAIYRKVFKKEKT